MCILLLYETCWNAEVALRHGFHVMKECSTFCEDWRDRAGIMVCIYVAFAPRGSYTNLKSDGLYWFSLPSTP